MEKVLLIGKVHQDGSTLDSLRRAGFLVQEVSSRLSGWPGLSRVREERPDIILVEERMVIVERMDVLSALRHSTSAPILVTGAGSEESVITALLRGADAYVPHTVTVDVLLAHVKALLRRHTLSSAVA